MTILKLQKDSLNFGEHSRYLQSMSEVCRKFFLLHFQKSKGPIGLSLEMPGFSLRSIVELNQAFSNLVI